MPVPQENSLFVERASCPFWAGRMPTPQENSLFVEQASCPFWAGRMPTPQENSLFVEQASCLLLRRVEDISFNRLEIFAAKPMV
ncbi:hypothetical protein [Microcoleus sp. T2B6]|uniref:hypothetical protein n=1 Tax=Microcoleus sp. T2B6 TaxID=3055424 RepID=UPI002FD6BD90